MPTNASLYHTLASRGLEEPAHASRGLEDFCREGRKPWVFMNPRVIPTCIAFWSGWRERMESCTEKTLRWNMIVIGDFLNLGGVSHECR